MRPIRMHPVRMLAALCALALTDFSLAGRAEAHDLASRTEARDAKQEYCLALAIYWEARAESLHGMLAVASVVLNRVRHPKFPDTVCEVVHEGGEKPPCQFSWWCDGKSDLPTEGRAWWRAQAMAEAALHQPPYDSTVGALFFHADYIRKPWAVPRTRTVQIGRHIFYR
jgi:N-acetylmuramoyl-L-alanine amidase